MKSRILRVAGLSMLSMAISTVVMAENQDPQNQQHQQQQQRPQPQAPQQQRPQPQVQQQHVQQERQQEMQGQQRENQQREQQNQQRENQQREQQNQQRENQQREQQGQQRENQQRQQQEQQRQLQTQQLQQRQQQDQQRQQQTQQLQQRQQDQQHQQQQQREQNQARPLAPQASPNNPGQGRNDHDHDHDQNRPGNGQGGQWQGHNNQGGNPGQWQGGGHSDNVPHRDPGHWEGRPSGHGNGWGPGPQRRPGFVMQGPPPNRQRVPYHGGDYWFSDGYWYQPRGNSYIVVRPPRGVRVSYIPDYAEEVWIGGALFFLAADTYYQWGGSDYQVVDPPVEQVPVQAPPPPVQGPPPVQQGSPYDPVAYPMRGQTQAQIEQDRYDCYRWAVGQSGFDPAQGGYAPAPQVADQFRRAMGACYAGRGYSVQ